MSLLVLGDKIKYESLLSQLRPLLRQAKRMLIQDLEDLDIKSRIQFLRYVCKKHGRVVCFQSAPDGIRLNLDRLDPHVVLDMCYYAKNQMKVFDEIYKISI